jgi:ABC-2 type transport system ATP-binding protein
VEAIRVEHLRRVYRTTIGTIRRRTKEVVAVEDISFNVQAGELFGLLGPNGAGKTTTVKVLTTLLVPTSGQVRVLGRGVVDEADTIRPRIGFIFGGERGLYTRLSAVDNLRYFASLYHLEPAQTKRRIPELLELVGLDGRGQEKVEGYSRGMNQRVHLARMLLHEPDILFLDEPTMGLDPVGAREIRQVVRDLQLVRKTILLTTHTMFEADELCKRIAVINHGRIVALDTPAGLKRFVQDLAVIEVEVFGLSPERLDHLRAQPFVDTLAVQERDERQVLQIHSRRAAERVSDVLGCLNGVPVGRVSVREPTLEDAYVRLVEGQR